MVGCLIVGLISGGIIGLIVTRRIFRNAEEGSGTIIKMLLSFLVIGAGSALLIIFIISAVFVLLFAVH